MILLSFAYRGEAAVFLRENLFRPVPFQYKGLYQSREYLLLCTGGGTTNAVQKVAAVCAAFPNQLKKVINLGIAGSLDRSTRVGEIYSIRHAFLEPGDASPPFFTSDDPQAKIDCVSSARFISDKKEAQRLAKIAPLVDQELWGCASACSRHLIPFRSYKLVSDFAARKTSVSEIISKAAAYSQQLYDFFLNLPPL